eukprot:gene8959-5739_t
MRRVGARGDGGRDAGADPHEPPQKAMRHAAAGGYGAGGYGEYGGGGGGAPPALPGSTLGGFGGAAGGFEPAASGAQARRDDADRGRQVCYDWRDLGKCRFGSQCRYRHA